jgi:hypothetical protein
MVEKTLSISLSSAIHQYVAVNPIAQRKYGVVELRFKISVFHPKFHRRMLRNHVLCRLAVARAQDKTLLPSLRAMNLKEA